MMRYAVSSALFMCAATLGQIQDLFEGRIVVGVILCLVLGTIALWKAMNSARDNLMDKYRDDAKSFRERADKLENRVEELSAENATLKVEMTGLRAQLERPAS